MRAKGIAVSQIILLVLGILVLAVVAYLLYTNFVTTGTTISSETCRAEATRSCTGCLIATAGTATTCPFTRTITGTNPLQDTNLGKCEKQGNLHLKGNDLDCAQYTGGQQLVCVESQKPTCTGTGEKPNCENGAWKCVSEKASS